MKTVNHDYLESGMYVANTIKPKGLFTKKIYVYDVRMKKPNGRDFINIKPAHSIEHLIADTMKKLYPGKVISWNMFMCQTGGYLETYLEPEEAREAILETIDNIMYLEVVPFATRQECGNYKTHDLEGAKKELMEFAKLLERQMYVPYYKELPQNEVE